MTLQYLKLAHICTNISKNALNRSKNKKNESLKGLSTLNWTCSGFKDSDLLILPLIFIFHFGETPASGRNSGHKMSNPDVKSY